MEYVKTLFICLALLLPIVPWTAQAEEESIFSLIEKEFGGRNSVESASGFYCSWAPQPEIKFLGAGGWMFAEGAKTMPQDVCFSVIRLLPILMNDLKLDGRDVSYDEAYLEFAQFSRTKDGKSTEQVLGNCKAMALKKPYDKMTPELKLKIINTFKSQGFKAGLKELENFLNENITLTCYYS